MGALPAGRRAEPRAGSLRLISLAALLADATGVYRKLKLGRSDGEVRQGWRVI